MTNSSQTWLDPKSISQAKTLELLARSISKGFLLGKHKSQRLSNGYEFAQYRPYIHGDDLRLIDWKLYAKTDKYYIKQSNVERDHDFHIIIDNSLSMNYAEDGWSKLAFAKLVAAAIGYIAIQQGDSLSMSSTDSLLNKSSGIKHWKTCVQFLSELKGIGSESKLQTNPQNNTVYIYLTDLYSDIEQIRKHATTLKQLNTDLLVFHLLGRKESQLDFGRNASFIDLESSEEIQLNPSEYRNRYMKKVENHINACKQIFFEKSVYFETVYINDPAVNVLRSLVRNYNRIIAR